MESRTEHWNRIYRETDDEQLGWYEEDPAPTFKLLEQVPGWEKFQVFLPGIGTSMLADRLVERGARLIVNDLSAESLSRLSERLEQWSGRIQCVHQSIAERLGPEVPEVDLWIDRAVLHFLINEPEIDRYFHNLKTQLRPGGYALFAEFPPHGAPECTGLELHRYSLDGLQERLGDGFDVVDHFDHVYINPAGQPRPYLYALFKRKEAR